MLDKNKEDSTIYIMYRETLFRIGMKYSNGDRMLAEDAVQETFLRYYEAIESGKIIREESLRNYLITITKNYILNYMKKTEKEHLTAEVIVYSTKKSLENNLEQMYFTELENYKDMQHAIQLLYELKEYNRNWYYVVVQVFYYGKSQVEVSKELEVSKESIYAMISRIRVWGKKKVVTLN